MAEPIIKHGLSKVIVSFVYYNSLIRDTLEYTLEKKEYKIEHYEYRKNGIINEPKVNSPLHNFIENNGEKGKEFLGKIEDFIDLLYSDDSTIIRKAADGLRVDHAQHIAIFEAVAPLNEEIRTILNLHMNLAVKENLVEPAITRLLAEDDRFFRATILSTIHREIQKQFQEFNKLMNESKGQPTPASNFVQQDLSKLVGIYQANKQYARCKDNVYLAALDAVGHMIEMMGGRRDLPVGKKFADVFKDVEQATAAFVTDAQKRWAEIYVPCVNVLMEDAKAFNEKQTPAA